MIDANPYTASGFDVLKVETHLHTLHSDGQDSVASMFDACRSAGYDAVAISDHNTLSGLDEAQATADRLGLILLPGVEVTTFHGHAVVLGVSRVPEWRDLETRGIDALAAEVHAEGGVLCICHPAALGSPVCSGCTWTWPIQAASIDLWEVFSASRPHVGVPLALWRQRLESGGYIAPVAAGDVHSAAAAARQKIATHVYVRERSQAGVLDALRQRRSFASDGTRLDFWLERPDGARALVGSRVGAGDWTPRLSAGRVCQVDLDQGGRCLYVELDDAQGRVLGLSAPIWISTTQ
jgi:hypothetical protein